MEEYGRCYECGKLLPLEVLKQKRFFVYHKHHGDFHHKLFCYTCLKKADEAGKEAMRDKY